MPQIIARDVVHEPLYAIVPLTNQWRWRSRWKHTQRAIKHFIDAGAVVVLVEVAFNRRDLVFADCGIDGMAANCGILGTDSRFRHKYIGLRSSSELWLKENIVNVAVQALPYDWQQVCWLDSDVMFMRPNWVGECIHKLQHYSLIQMFSHARDLGPTYEMLDEDYPHADGIGFVQAWQKGQLNPIVAGDIAKIRSDLAILSKDIKKLEADLQEYPYPPRVWPGLAWAAQRKAWDDLGGLIDVAVWGGGDFHQGWALAERPDMMMRADLHPNYKKVVSEWYERCKKHIRKNVGVMQGSIVHAFHGRKSQRGYGKKHELLAKIGFDPTRHLKKDSQGLWQLHDDGSDSYVQIRDLMREIALERNEDTTEIYGPESNQGH